MTTLNLTGDVLELNLQSTKSRIERFIKGYVEKRGARGVVIGVSGGVDSCTTAALASLALGGSRVLDVVLPEGEEVHDTTDVQRSRTVAKKFGFGLEVVNISPTLRVCFASLPIYDATDEFSKGNLKTRIRMVYTHYYANRLNRLVCGTSDKSEIMMGYFTKWGDAAADVSPLMDLYKTQVRKLASYIGIPKDIIAKSSTPTLWQGHGAEKGSDIGYETLDLILFGLERFMTTRDIAEQLNLPMKPVEGIKSRWLASEHKRRIPLTTKLGYKTIGVDLRLPYT